VARGECFGVREALTSLIPDAELERLARETGMVQRRRKVKVAAFFWTLVLGFGAGRIRPIGALRRSYERATGQSRVPSAFHDRFTPPTTRFLRTVLGTALGPTRHDRAASGRRPHGVPRCTDGQRHPGSRTNSSPAAAKLHLVMRETGTGMKSVEVTHVRACEHRVLRVGP